MKQRSAEPEVLARYQEVAQLLTDAAAQGRLPLSEYEKRLAEAYAAKTYDELDRLTDDLPGLPEPAHGRGACKPAPSTLLLAILSGFERRGRWNVPGRMTTFTLFGGGVVRRRAALPRAVRPARAALAPSARSRPRTSRPG